MTCTPHARFACMLMAAVISLALVPGAARAVDGCRALPAQAASTADVVKADNPMKAKAKKAKITIRYALVKKSSQTIKKAKAKTIMLKVTVK